MREVPKGQRRCEDCTFFHPERPKRICSVFRTRENRDGYCSAYIDDRPSEGGGGDGEAARRRPDGK